MNAALQAACTLVGFWLAAAPVLLGYGGAPAVSDWIVGPLVASHAIVAMWPITSGARWVNVALGAWLVISPVVLGHGTAAAVSDVASGLAVAGLSLPRPRPRRATGGGWASLRRA